MNDAEIIAQEFPINSQTSVADKWVLLRLRDILRQQQSRYSFLEIGSFLGGSMTPFLRDPQCARILSIDERNRQLPDERGVILDYAGVTHQSMIDNLLRQNLEVGKLETFDGSVDRYEGKQAGFDLLFVDGEHTDLACFRDFIHGRRLLKDDAIVVFHDSMLVYKALRMIQEFLRATGARFKFLKVRGSEMSCIFYNKFVELDLGAYFEVENNLDGFYRSAENLVLAKVIENRLNINLGLRDAPMTRGF